MAADTPPSAPPRRPPALKRGLSLLLRLGIGLGLVAWLFSKVDVASVTSRWRNVDWLLLAPLVILFHATAILLKSVRQRRLLRGMHLHLPIWWLSLLQLKGNFLRNLLPSSLSGDVYRAYVLARTTGQAYESVSTTIIEKSFGVAATLTLSVVGLLCGLLLLGHAVFLELVEPLAWIGGGFLACVVPAVLFLRSGWTARFSAKWQDRIRKLKALFRHRRDTAFIFLLSLLIQLPVIAWYFSIAHAMDLQIGLLPCIVTVPLIEILLLAPITVGGIGVREGAFALLLQPFGLGVAEALSFGLLSFFVALVIRILSGLAFLSSATPAAVKPAVDLSSGAP